MTFVPLFLGQRFLPIPITFGEMEAFSTRFPVEPMTSRAPNPALQPTASARLSAFVLLVVCSCFGIEGINLQL